MTTELLNEDDWESLRLVDIRRSRLSHSLLRIRELQADEVEDFGSMGVRKILDKLAELHLAVRLPCHVYHINYFVTT